MKFGFNSILCLYDAKNQIKTRIMLVEFTVSNFRSIHEPQTWSMVAAPALKEREDRNTFLAPPPAKNLRLLRSAALYGPNAAGKSTLVEALHFMKQQVVNSARESQQGDLIPVVPFKLTADSRAADSEFSVQFIEAGKRYEYGFRCNKVRFTEEWLYAYPTARAQKWFHRVYDAQTGKDAYAPFSEHFLGGQQRHVWAKETRLNALFLSRCMQSNNEQLRPVFEWFSQRLRVVPRPEALRSDFTVKQCEDPKVRAEVLGFLNAADLSIDGIRLEHQPFSTDMLPPKLSDAMRQELTTHLKGKDLTRVKFQRRDTATGDMIEFDDDEESDGTRALFAFAGPWLDVINQSRVLVVDELDSSLHPLVVRHLVAMLQNGGTQAQLLFTTHDTTLLSQKLLRRDQVWFVEKNGQREARLYPLSDFSPRENEAIERGYLNGRYGGIPNLQDLDFYGA